MHSVNFKMVLLESSLQWGPDEKNFDSVSMLRHDRLLKMSSQKNIAFPKPCELEEETDVTFYSIFEGSF